MPVRRLASEDIRWIVEELRELPKQSKKFADVPDDPKYVGAFFGTMHNHNQLDGVVEEYTGSFLLFTPVYPWYAARLEIHELILWVPVRHRGSFVAPRLITAFKGIAKLYNPHSIHAGATLDITDRDRVLRLYEAAGFQRDDDGVVLRL